MAVCRMRLHSVTYTTSNDRSEQHGRLSIHRHLSECTHSTDSPFLLPSIFILVSLQTINSSLVCKGLLPPASCRIRFMFTFQYCKQRSPEGHPTPREIPSLTGKYDILLKRASPASALACFWSLESPRAKKNCDLGLGHEVSHEAEGVTLVRTPRLQAAPGTLHEFLGLGRGGERATGDESP